MKILAVEKEIKSISGEAYNSILKKEAEKVYQLMKDDIIREIYFTEEDHCAVIIMECENKSSAKLILESLPLVKQKYIEFEIKQLVPYDGLSRLIGS